ncbi:MAG: hypothetical protein J6D12_07835 [Peptostreptococcaceae bacterium]|nr:hypothetical protein [Peptostreptococcaceae bacterium]
MNNKILITVFVPLLDENYDLFIPVNKKVGTIKKGIISSIKNLVNKDYLLMLKSNCEVIDDNIYVKNSEIKNGSKLILL